MNVEIFTKEAQVLIENWRRHYNAARPHSLAGLPAPRSRSDLATSIWPAHAPLRPAQMLAKHGRVLT